MFESAERYHQSKSFNGLLIIYSETTKERVGNRSRTRCPRVCPVCPATRLVRFVNQRRPVYDIRPYR